MGINEKCPRGIENVREKMSRIDKETHPPTVLGGVALLVVKMMS